MDGKKIRLNDTEEISKNDFNEITVHDGCIQQIPCYEDRECLYLTGPSGSGKSTQCVMYCREWKKMNKGKDNNIVLISPIEDDDNVNSLNPLRLSLSEENFIDPDTKIDLEELSNCCVLFDDIDAIPEKQIKEACRDLRNRILLTGRHHNITSLSTSHIACNYKETRDCLNESHYITFFPAGGSNYHIKRFLKSYCGLSNDEIKKILSLPSRWVTLHTKYPMYVMSKDYAYVINPKKIKEESDSD